MTIANGPPSPVADAISVNRGANPGLTFDPRTNDADPGMDPFTVTNKTNGTKGAVTIGSGGTSVTYKPNAAVFGADSFTYTVTDDQGASATGTVNVDIVFVNTGPTAVNDSAYKRATSSANMWVQLDPRFNDSDPQGDVLTVTAKTNGAYGTVSILNAGTAVKYQRTSNFPPAGQTRNDTFTYTITETYGLTATATVTVTIDNIPNDPMCGGSPC